MKSFDLITIAGQWSENIGENDLNPQDSKSVIKIIAILSFMSFFQPSSHSIP